MRPTGDVAADDHGLLTFHFPLPRYKKILALSSYRKHPGQYNFWAENEMPMKLKMQDGRASLGRRVDGFEKREPVEIRVSGVDPFDPMFAHEDRCLGVIEEVAVQERRFAQDLRCDRSVLFRGDKQAKGWGSKNGLQVCPGLSGCPRLTKNPRMGDHP